MKLLVDTCVAESVYKELVNAGYDAEWTGDWDDDPGDSEILRIAYIEGRILVILDKQFGELAVREGKIHCGIIRLGKLRIAEQAQRCIDALEDFRCYSSCWAGADKVSSSLASDLGSTRGPRCLRTRQELAISTVSISTLRPHTAMEHARRGSCFPVY